MNHSILIADDSLTIQKVIRITLSGESYDLSDCDRSKKLFELTESTKPSLVLLDFSLDEGISGYDICKKIQRISPETKVMIMYGTFDSVDDELFLDSGASGKIIKPFDGQKFITMCHQILENQEFYGVTPDESPLNAIEEQISEEYPLEINAEEVSEIEELDPEDDEWSLNDEDIELAQDTQDILSNTNTEEDSNYSFQSLISDELNDWGMSVPPTLSIIEKPELIDEVKEKVSEIAAVADLTVEDESENLDFDFSKLVEVEADHDHDHDHEPEAVKLEIVEDIEEDDDLGMISVNSEGELQAKELIDFDLNNNEDKFDALESLLMNDDEEVDDLWKIDEPSTIEEVAERVTEVVEKEILDDKASSFIVEQSDIQQAVREYMSKHGKAIIEKVAWDMIPDMAENIIREEVKSMAQKVLSKD